MTKILNLWAGGGTGKSTQAARLFTLLKAVEKDWGIKVELVREFAKEYAWMRTPLSQRMQRHIYFEQLKREQQLEGLVDYIITDSPTGIGVFYNQYYNQDETLFSWERHKRLQGSFVDFWCPRVKPYNPEGRYETEEQAHAVDAAQREFLNKGYFDTLVYDLKPRVDFSDEIFELIKKDEI
jgi:hypothetical protein